MSSEPNTAELLGKLASEDGMVREAARKALVQIGGHEVTRALVIELNDPRKQVRWEAAKALISIADPIAAPALAHHLLDEDQDIRWLVAEGLAALGDAGLQVTLRMAIGNAGNSSFAEAAHHTFAELKKRQSSLAANLDELMRAANSSTAGSDLPVAAHTLLCKLRNIELKDARRT